MKQLKQILNKRSLETRPWIIWIWNGPISEKETVSQVTALIAQGIGGLVIKPGKDMVPLYLSEEFFILFKLVLEKAKENGIGIRIGDDLSMPWSGCFTELCNQNPSLRAQSLVLAETCIKREREVFEYVPHNHKKTMVIVARTKGGMLSATEQKILPLSADKPLHWKAPQGEWRIMVFNKEYVCDLAGGNIPNVYNTRAAQLYIQNVLNLFRKRFTKYIGSTFKGFLTEMPAYRTADNALPWDDDLVVKFRTKYKKDLLKYLPSLFFDAPQAARIRNQVYAYLDQSMYERFALPIEVWSKNAKLSQWVLCPERSIHRMNHALIDGDFHTDKGLAFVGLQNIDGLDENFPHLRAMADINRSEYRRGTIAVIGRNRNGAAATPQSLKTEIDLQLLAGATQIIIDGCFYAIDRRSYLKTPHNPVWYHYLGETIKPLCEYTSRMLELLRDTATVRSVAVLSPASAIRALYTPMAGEPVRDGNQYLNKTANALVRQALDFEIMSEELLLHCTARAGGEFSKGEKKGKSLFNLLVVPYAPLVSRSLLVFLEKLVSKQGTVLFINEAPKGTFEDGVNSGVTRRVEKLLSPKKSASRVVAAEEIDAALAALPHRMIKLVQVEDTIPEIMCTAAAGQTYALYGFHNRSERQEFSVKAEVPSGKRMTFINCLAGTAHEIEHVHHEDGRCVLSLHLLPQQTVLLAATSAAVATAASKSSKGTISPFALFHRNYRVVLKNQWSFEALTMNALPLSSWSQRIGLSREAGGFSHFFESHFQVGTLPETCYLVMNTPSGNLDRTLGAEAQIEINVNGTRVDRPIVPSTAFSTVPENMHTVTTAPSEVISYIVPEQEKKVQYLFGAPVTLYTIGSLLAKGFNRVSLRTYGTVIDPPTVLYPPLVLGFFSIVRGQNGWVIEKSGANVGNDSWTKYGYPYLSGMGIYRQSFEVPHQYNRLILRMSNVSGIVEIMLNGKPVAPKFLFQPIEVDITHHCEHKRNELSISVANTIDNVLRMSGRASGILGDVYLDVT